eukprot:12987968-Alexandrium_andersonii.AAC.1
MSASLVGSEMCIRDRRLPGDAWVMLVQHGTGLRVSWKMAVAALVSTGYSGCAKWCADAC